MNQPKSIEEQIEQNSRQIKHAVFFAVLLVFMVLVVGVYFIVIGQNASKVEQEKQTQQRLEQINEKWEESERDFKARWGQTPEERKRNAEAMDRSAAEILEESKRLSKPEK